MPRLPLQDQVAVVTGGTGTLGGAIAAGLAQAGARVVIMSRSEEDTAAHAKTLRQRFGGAHIGVAADVLNPMLLISAYEDIIQQTGSVDILINAAGGNVSAATVTAAKPFFELPTSALQHVLNLNFIGSVIPSQVFGRHMAEQQSGVILNVSSMAAQRPLTRVVGYAAGKAAIENFTRWLAVHMAQEYSPNIRVNAIAPGFFVAEQNRDLLLNPDGSLTERGTQIIDHTPMARFGKPEDLIGAVNWLCSDAAQFVTGVVIPIDGGFSAFGGV